MNPGSGDPFPGVSLEDLVKQAREHLNQLKDGSS